MGGFSRAELESYRGRSVPDLIGERCKLLFVGINPGLWAVPSIDAVTRGERGD